MSASCLSVSCHRFSREYYLYSENKDADQLCSDQTIKKISYTVKWNIFVSPNYRGFSQKTKGLIFAVFSLRGPYTHKN